MTAVTEILAGERGPFAPTHDPERLRASYLEADPFPHIVLDGLFDEELVGELLADFPGPDDALWNRFENQRERKLGFDYRARLPQSIGRFLGAMSSPVALSFLERLTGIEGLIPDPYFGGAGPHQILPGGFLKVHADFNVHPKLKLDRRLNLLLYLNRGWREEWGGALELWARDMSRCERRIAPIFNRTVVFSTTSDSFHGHPDPLAAPEGTTRKSISLYYYTCGRPAEESSAPHDTLFAKRHEAEW